MARNKTYIIGLVFLSSLVLLTYTSLLKKDSPQESLDPNLPEDTSLNWTIVFGDKKVFVSRMGSGNVDNTFWNNPIVEVDSEMKTIDDIFNGVPDKYQYNTQLIYSPGNKAYYWLNPGGYTQLSLVSSQELEEKSKNNTSYSDPDSNSGVTLIQTQKPFMLSYTGGPSAWKAVENASFHVFEGNEVTSEANWLSDGYVVTCYIPIGGSSLFLEVSTPLKTAGSEINNCDILSSMGVQSVSLVN